MKGLPNEVNSSGAVSPAPRATASRHAGDDAAQSRREDHLHDGARVGDARGRGRPPAGCMGIRRRVSSVARVMTGSMIMAREMPAREAPRNVPWAAPPRHRQRCRVTMEGIPMRVSTERRATVPSRVLPLSERNIPAMTPRGTEMTDAMRIRMQRADDGVGDPSPGLSHGLRQLGEKLPVDGGGAAHDDEQEDQHQGDGGDERQGKHQAPGTPTSPRTPRRDTGVQRSPAAMPRRSSVPYQHLSPCGSRRSSPRC